VGRAWTAIGEEFLKPCCLSSDGHNRKNRTQEKKQTLVHVPSSIGSLKAGSNYLQAYYFLSTELNTFRKRVKTAVARKGIQVGMSVNKRGVVMWSELMCFCRVILS